MCSVPRQSQPITTSRRSRASFTPAAVMPALRARTASRTARRSCACKASSWRGTAATRRAGGPASNCAVVRMRRIRAVSVAAGTRDDIRMKSRADYPGVITDQEAAMPITVERVDFVPVASRDRERSKSFYTETLGLPLERDTPTGFEVRAGQVTLGVWEPERMGLPFEPNHNGISLRVPDVAEARATLERDGVEFTGETIDTGVCHMAFLHDPDGNTIMLHRRYAPV